MISEKFLYDEELPKSRKSIKRDKVKLFNWCKDKPVYGVNSIRQEISEYNQKRRISDKIRGSSEYIRYIAESVWQRVRKYQKEREAKEIYYSHSCPCCHERIPCSNVCGPCPHCGAYGYKDAKKRKGRN